MLREFLSWWVGQLADFVPERWRRSASGDALVIAPVGPLAGGIEAVGVSLRRNGRETPLGEFGFAAAGLADLPRSGGRPVVLRLTEADVLCKTVTLPLAAERQLDHVLAFEMDRETPFSPEEIFWNHRVAQRDRSRGQLAVRLLLVPRASLAALLGALAKVGILPKRAEIGDGPDRGCYLPLDADGGGLHDPMRRRLLRWPAAALCAGLAVAVIAVPFARQTSALAELDQEIDRLTGTVDLIESERDKAGRPLITLATLTRVLPDDTYLTELQLQQHKVILSGRSVGASRLIGALAAGNQLRNPAFAAPVTRIEAAKAELFTITAEVGP